MSNGMSNGMSTGLTDGVGWSVGLDLPEGTWYSLPLDAPDPQAEVQALAAELTTHADSSLAAELAGMVEQSLADGCVTAAVLLPPDSPHVVALLAVRPVEAPSDLGVAHDEVSAEISATGATAEVELRDLPAGKSLRLRQVSAGTGLDDGGGLVLETLTYVVVAPAAAPEAVEVTASWVALALGDTLSEMVDAVALTLRVEPAVT